MMLKRLVLGAALTASMSLGGCSSADREGRHWTEDVQLEDGSIVGIERHVAFDETNALGGGAYNAVETQSTLKFTGEFASLPAWDFPRIALVLYRNRAGNWVVVSATSSCRVWRREGKPRPPYWQHELVGSQWQLVAVSGESVGRKTNLFYHYWKDDFPDHITPDVSRARQSDPTIADVYQHIAAQPKDFHC